MLATALSKIFYFTAETLALQALSTFSGFFPVRALPVHPALQKWVDTGVPFRRPVKIVKQEVPEFQPLRIYRLCTCNSPTFFGRSGTPVISRVSS